MTCENTCKCEKISRCISLTCFGKFLHTVIAGWDDSECIKAFEAINNHTAINKKVKMIVNSKPGKKVKMIVNSKPGKETHSNETVNLINR